MTELFQYTDENAQRQSISSGDVNDYLRKKAIAQSSKTVAQHLSFSNALDRDLNQALA